MATSAVKKSKKSWEEFGRRLDSNYFSANKIFWQTIRRLRGKRSSVTYSIKDSAGNILTDENEILSRWREYFEDLLNPVKASTRDTHEVTHLREDEVFTAAQVATPIKGIKSGKAAGEDEIRPEMLKALTGEGILWLTRVCQVAWKLGKTPRDWQTGVIIPIFTKGDRKQSTNYRGISLLSLPGKVYAKCLERKCREIVESKLEDGQCGFRPGRSTTYQIFTLKQIFEKSWEYGKDHFACFVDLEKAYDRVPRDKLWKVLQEYGVNGRLLQMQVSEMRFLRRIEGVTTLFNKVRSSEIRKSLNIEPLLLRIERSQLRRFSHVSRMPQERLPTQLYLPKQMGEDQLDDVKVDGPITLRILDEPLGTSPKRNDGGHGRPWVVFQIQNKCIKRRCTHSSKHKKFIRICSQIGINGDKEFFFTPIC